MLVRFWGVRGSIATPLSNQQLRTRLESVLKLAIEKGLNSKNNITEFLNGLPNGLHKTAGGDTSCVEIRANNELIIIDAGSGIRQLGLDLNRKNYGKPLNVHILVSHTHWDHICGFPFFVPAYIPNSTINFYGPQEGLESRFRRQQESEFFPVSLDSMAADIRFNNIAKHAHFNIGEIEIQTLPLKHPGGCFAYRITHNDKSFIYANDGEYNDLSESAMQPYLDFFKNADLMLFDAQYTLVDSVEKENWGHSNAFMGIDIALQAGVKQLILGHHEPTYDDTKLWTILEQAKEYLTMHPNHEKLIVELAQEGLEVNL